MKQHSAAINLSDATDATRLGASSPANDAAGAGHSSPDALTPRDRALQLVALIAATWPNMVRLSKKARAASSGRMAQRFASPLASLFAIAAQPRFRPAFSLLRMRDGAGSEVPLDLDVVTAWLTRAATEREVAAELRKLADVLDDDALHHGALAVRAGLPLLKTARTLAENNSEFHAEAAHVLDAFKAMTAPARKAAEAAAVSADTDDDTESSSDEPVEP